MVSIHLRELMSYSLEQQVRQEAVSFCTSIRAQSDTLLARIFADFREFVYSCSMTFAECSLAPRRATLNLLYLVHDLVHVDAVAVSQLLEVAISALKHNSSHRTFHSVYFQAD